MLHVEIENIMSEEDAVNKARQLIDRVDSEKQLVVITRQNRPAVAMIDIPRLEELTGKTVTPVAPASTVIEHLNAYDAGDRAPAETTTPETVPTMEYVPEIAPVPVAMQSEPEVAPIPTEPALPSTPPPYQPAPSYVAQQPLAEPAPLPPIEPAAVPEPVPQTPEPPVFQPSYAPAQPVANQTEQLPDMPSDPSNGSPLA